MAAFVPLALGAACSHAATAPPPARPVFTPPSIAPSPQASPLPARGTYVARPLERKIPIWKHPSTSDPSLSLWAENPVGARIEMLVTDGVVGKDGTSWLKVLLPERPNDSTAWVHADSVQLLQTHERIVVDLSARTLAHYVDGNLVDRFRVGIGQPQWPTATGTFYVWAQVPQASASGPYGVFALGLSGFSPVLKNWPGGGRMAIHGTSDPADLGHQVSHGCVRVYNPDMTTLRQVPLGTPVIIHQ